MIFTIADGTQKDIEIGNAVVCVDGVLPPSVSPGAFILVANLTANGVQAQVIPQGGWIPQPIDISPDLIIQVWSKQ